MITKKNVLNEQFGKLGSSQGGEVRLVKNYLKWNLEL